MNVNLPLITLRDYQKPVWNSFFNTDRKIHFIVWHRRCGKDVLCLNALICKAIEKVGNYYYILPQQNQVRRAIWEGVTKEGVKYLSYFPEEAVFKKNESEMKVFLKDPNDTSKAGSIISFIGGDNYDALAGAGISGCVISELSLQKPSLYKLILKPMLRETGGFCLINTTPRGKNHAYELLEALKKNPDKYFTSVLTIEDTGFLTDDDLNEEREQGISEEKIQQEYYCSFEGAVEGSYYGDLLRRYEDRVGDYPYDARYPVYTTWDLGLADSMVIWFIQFIENSIHIIDYYENSSFDFAHYVNLINTKKYLYASHNIPHDGRQRKTSTQTVQEKALRVDEQLKVLGLVNVIVHSRTDNIYGEISAVRSLLSRVCFDKEKTADGYEDLKQYHRAWDERRQRFKDTAEHDGTSHAADAFRLIPRIKQHKAMKKHKAKIWNAKF